MAATRRTRESSPGGGGFMEDVFGCDVRALAVARVCVGAALLQDAADKFPHAALLLASPQFGGVLAPPPPYTLSLLHLSVGLPPQVLLGVQAVMGVLLLLGVWSRCVCCAAALYMICTPLEELEHGGDCLLRLVAMWVCTLPIGRVWAWCGGSAAQALFFQTE